MLGMFLLGPNKQYGGCQSLIATVVFTVAPLFQLPTAVLKIILSRAAFFLHLPKFQSEEVPTIGIGGMTFTAAFGRSPYEIIAT
jgi:hypothetical protein